MGQNFIFNTLCERTDRRLNCGMPLCYSLIGFIVISNKLNLLPICTLHNRRNVIPLDTGIENWHKFLHTVVS
jgi:hypothetical protein